MTPKSRPVWWQVCRAPSLVVNMLTLRFDPVLQEESHYAGINDIVQLCDRQYSKVDICQMEENVLRTIEWRLSAPTASHFIEYYLYIMSLWREINVG